MTSNSNTFTRGWNLEYYKICQIWMTQRHKLNAIFVDCICVIQQNDTLRYETVSLERNTKIFNIKYSLF